MLVKGKGKHIKRSVKQQKQADHRNKFFKKIEKLCSVLGCYDIYRIIPKSELKRFYKYRVMLCKIKSADESVITKEVLQSIQSFMDEILFLVKVDITESKVQLCLYDYFTAACSFIYYLKELKGDEYRDAEVVKQFGNRFKPYQTIFDDAVAKLIQCLNTACFVESDLDKRIYWATVDYANASGKTFGIECIVKMNSIIPEVIYDNRDNIERKLIRVCWGFANGGLKHFETSCMKLQHEYNLNTPVNSIYIQPHALFRMKERLDGMEPFWLNVHFVNSMCRMKIRHYKENKYFIEYTLDSITVGYFVADLKEEKLIIRTFLLLTQNGTPEGDRISELCGLNKVDKSYLKMDRITTFISTDMCSHPRLKEIFNAAGCHYLLDVYDNSEFKKMLVNNSKQSNVSEIVQYLMLDNDKKEMHLHKHGICKGNKYIAPW